MKYVHTNIISTDWKKLARFYIQVFDCQLVPPERDQSGDWLDKGLGLKNARLRGVHLRLPGYGENGPTLEIYSYDDMVERLPNQANKKGYGHLAFEVEKVRDILEKILENGGSAHGEISGKEVPGVGYITFVYAADPEGNILELQHWDYSRDKG